MTDASALLAAIDASGPPADLRIHTAAFATLLATFALHDPSFTLVEPTLSLVKRPAIEATAVASGNAAVWEIRNGAGAQLLSGTLGQGTGQIRIDRAALLSGAPLGLAALALLVTGPGVATASGRIALGRASATADFAPPLATGALRYQGDVLADSGTNLLRFNPSSVAGFAATGATGPRGFEGEQGPEGSQGIQGAAGATGSVGPQGAVQALAVRAVTEDPAEEPGEYFPRGWGASLRSNPRTGGASAFVDAGDYLNFGADGPITANPQIRSGEANFRIRGTSAVQLISGTNLTCQAVAGTLTASCTTSAAISASAGPITLTASTDITENSGATITHNAGTDIVKITAFAERLRIKDTGEWQLASVGGVAGQALTSQGPGVAPIWATPGSGTRDSLLPLLTGVDDNPEPGEFVPRGLASMLASWPRSGGSNVWIDAGQFVNFGLDGPTAGNPQIRSGDALLLIRGGTDVQLMGGAAASLQANFGNASVTAQNSVVLTTAATQRLTIGSAGDWNVGGSVGSSGQVLTSAGAGAIPTWSTIAMGPMGPSGQDGQDGQDGFPGLPGATGATGATGPTGPAGSGSVAPALAPLCFEPDVAVEPAEFIPLGWGNSLRSNPRSGGASAFMDVGDIINFGLAGPTTGQIRSGDALFRIHSSNVLHILGDTEALISGASGNTVLDLTAAATLTTNSTTRLAIASTGEWTTPAGSSGQVLTHQGAGAPPLWVAPASGASARDSLLPLLTSVADNDEDLEVRPRPGWASALASNPRSGGSSPTIDAGQSLILAAPSVALGGVITSTQNLTLASDVQIFNSSPSFAWSITSGTENFRFRGASGGCGIQLQRCTAPVSAPEANTALWWVKTETNAERAMFRTLNSTGATLKDWPLDCTGLAASPATAVVTNATTVMDITGTFTIPADTLIVGSRWRMVATYQFTRGATVTALNLGTFFNVGAVGVSTAHASPVGASATEVTRAEAEFTVLSVGAGGTCCCVLTTMSVLATGAAVVTSVVNLVLACNTTIALAVKGQAQMNAAVANCSILAIGGHIERVT